MAPHGMTPYNGKVVPNPARLNGSDLDLTPVTFRRYVSTGIQDVQLKNGVGQITMKRIGYRGAGYLFAAAPIIPGQTRGDAAGFHKRGPSPLNMQALWEAGPGSQPANPGGPGKLAGPLLNNPMTG